MQPHINFPYKINPELSVDGNAAWRGTLLFGEINHAFINPASEHYRAAIDANDAACPDDQALFNEYMNFGLITLYHHDRMNETDRSHGQTIADLYPRIIAWFTAQSAAAQMSVQPWMAAACKTKS